MKAFEKLIAIFNSIYDRYSLAFYSLFTRGVFTLLVNKVIAVSGSSGSLISLGLVQNNISLYSSISNFSSSSAVQFRLANKKDRYAMERVLIIIPFGIMISFIVYPFLSMRYNINLWSLFLSVVFSSIFIVCNSALIGSSRLKSFLYSNFIFGASLLFFVYRLVDYNVNSIINCFMYSYFIGALYSLYLTRFKVSVFDSKNNFKMMRQILKYGAVSLLNVVVLNLVFLDIRNSAITQFSSYEADVIEVLLRIAALFEAFVMAPIITAFISRFSQTGKIELFTIESPLIFSMLALSLSCLVYIIFSDYIIRLLFSSNQLLASDYSITLSIYILIKGLVVVSVAIMTLMESWFFIIIGDVLFILTYFIISRIISSGEQVDYLLNNLIYSQSIYLFTIFSFYILKRHALSNNDEVY